MQSARKPLLITSLTILLLLALGAVLALPIHGRTLAECWREARTGRIYSSGPTGGRVVALTFDDGPDARYTPRVLDILKARHVHATFFVVGRMLAARPDLGRRIVAEGHVIGNHTESHTHVESERDPAARAELESCESKIESVTGKRTYLFRPPRGWWDRAIFDDARSDGFRIVLWSLAFDRSAIHNPDALRRRVVGLAKPGDIILLHDGSSSKVDARRATVQELDSLIAGLQHRGFRFATVPELLHIAGDGPAPPSRQPRLIW